MPASIRPWLRTITVLVTALAVYVATALFVAWLSGDAIIGAAASNIVIGILALAHRRFSSGSFLAKELPATSEARTPHWWAMVGIALILAWLAGQLISMVVYDLFGDPVFDAHNQAQSTTPVLILLVTSLFLAPLGEESLMRGIAYTEVRRHWPPWAAAFVTTMVFALMHGNLVQIVLTVPLGILLAFVYEATGRLWPVIGMHVLFNFASVITPRASMEKVANPALAIAGLATFVVVLFVVYPRNRQDATQDA